MRASPRPRYCATTIVALATVSLAVPAQQIATSALSPLTFRHIGPVGNRISSVSGVVGDPLTYYVGAATGGVWKSSDGGIIWRPVFDAQEQNAYNAAASG